VFGLRVYVTNTSGDDKLLHAANRLAEYIDDDKDGVPDNPKIKAIANAMVDSGMREAGYVYLVLDDAWIAKKRDKNGRLVADPKKFPCGMKAIGDYIHRKGLKYGIYRDRGVS
jgi:hypothetical protein